MRVADYTELGLIGMASTVIALTEMPGPGEISVGYLVLICSGSLLTQSLIRDLWILAAARTRTPSGTPREAQCMCVESALGFTGVLAAGLILGSGLTEPVCVYDGGWAIFLAPTWLLGFVLKNYVIEWNPWRIRREKDHLNIIIRRPQ